MFTCFLLLLSVVFSLLLVPLVRRLAKRMGAVDQPGERKIHSMPVPRLGGVAIVASAVLTCLTVWGFELISKGVIHFDPGAWKPVLLGGAIMLLVGVWDDVRPVPAWVKFLFQAVAAGIAIWLGVRVEHVSLFGGEGLHLGALALPLTFLWIVGITNAFNLVDGLDGLAAGLAIIAAATSATIFFLLGDLQDALLLVIMLGALLGFLPYNFNPATIFLGDSGSLVVGYVLAVTAITGTQKGATVLAVAIPLLVFGLPIIDTLLSMVRRCVGSVRLLRSSKTQLKERIFFAKRMFEADQQHIHHRLLALGFSHRKAVLLLYLLALGLSSLALLSVLAKYRNAGVILLGVGLATYIGIRKLGYDEVVFLRTGTLLRWYEQITFDRRFFLGFVDLLLISLAYWGALWLKYEPPWTGEIVTWYRNLFPLVLIIQLIGFHVQGLYRGVWRAAEVGDFLRVGLAVLSAVAFSYVLALLSVPPQGVHSFFGIDTLLLGVLAIGVRSTYRVLDHFQQSANVSGNTALIYGAGQDGQLILRALRQQPHFELCPIGFLDDDVNLHGRHVHRLPVLGSGDQLKSIIESQSVSCLIISSRHIHGYRLHRVMSTCRERGIPVLQGGFHLVPIGTNGVTNTMLIVHYTQDS